MNGRPTTADELDRLLRRHPDDPMVTEDGSPIATDGGGRRANGNPREAGSLPGARLTVMAEDHEESRSLIDQAAAIGEAGAELLAAGGLPGVSFVGWMMGKIRASRDDRTASLHRSMGAAINAVREHVDTEFVKSAEYEALTEEILEKGARRREIEKREFYAAAFANSALPERPAEAERYRMIDTLERLRAPHLWLLAALLREYRWPDDGGGIGGGFEQEFKKAVPEADLAAVRLDWRDLEAAGLVQSFPSGMMTTEGARNFRARVTDLGRQFHQFVTLPYGDVHPVAE